MIIQHSKINELISVYDCSGNSHLKQVSKFYFYMMLSKIVFSSFELVTSMFELQKTIKMNTIIQKMQSDQNCWISLQQSDRSNKDLSFYFLLKKN